MGLPAAVLIPARPIRPILRSRMGRRMGRVPSATENALLAGLLSHRTILVPLFLE